MRINWSNYIQVGHIPNFIHLLDYVITIFFTIEILIRFIGEKEKKTSLKMVGICLIQ